MSPLLTAKNSYPRVADQRIESKRVIEAIEEMCVAIGTGGRLPRHLELMRTLAASERNVLRSLDELQRRGRIVRRHGSGTFVTDGDFKAHEASSNGSLIASRTIVAITVPDKSIFDRCIELLYKETTTADLNLSCHLIGDEQMDRIDVAAMGRPIGFLFFRRNFATLAKKLYEAGNRVVLVGAPYVKESHGVPTVCGNQEHGGYLSVKHLISLGHHRIGFCDVSGNLLNHPRWQGCLKALREAERAGSKIEYTFFDKATVQEWGNRHTLVAQYFGEVSSPTALVAWNDTEALELIATLSRAGVRVPSQLSVIGYDNMELGQRSHPSLTTIDHQIEQQVSTALSMLTSDEIVDASKTIVFAPTLIQRESTAPPSVR